MTKTRKILKLKHYKDSIQYTYSDIEYNRKILKGSSKKNHSTKDEINRCSLSRTVSNIKELCLCNEFEYFVTITIKSPKRNNVLFATKLLNISIKRYAKSREHFKYLYVFERQQKGGIHLHGFFSGFDDLYYNENGYLSSKFFDDIGFQCFENVEKVNPFYLIKYTTKEPIKELKHRYYRSKNLKKAEISYIHCNFDEFSNFGFTFKNQYCKMITVIK